jgi:hypothetical protein
MRTNSNIMPRMLPRMAPNIAVEMPREVLAAGTGEDGNGDAGEGDNPGNELDSALDDTREGESVEGSAVGVLVSAGVDGGGVADRVGEGDVVGGGVNPPYVQIPSLPRGIWKNTQVSSVVDITHGMCRL